MSQKKAMLVLSLYKLQFFIILYNAVLLLIQSFSSIARLFPLFPLKSFNF